jgi:hypothetical protein
MILKVVPDVGKDQWNAGTALMALNRAVESLWTVSLWTVSLWTISEVLEVLVLRIVKCDVMY